MKLSEKIEVVAMALEKYAQDMELKFNNLQVYTNNRLADMEKKYQSIDPKYLAMGDELSEANKNMINTIIDLRRLCLDELSNLSRRIDNI